MFDLLGSRKKESPFKDSATVEKIARTLRGNKNDEEWRRYLYDMAKRSVEILNLMVKHAGPSGVSFEISMVEKNDKTQTD